MLRPDEIEDVAALDGSQLTGVLLRLAYRVVTDSVIQRAIVFHDDPAKQRIVCYGRSPCNCCPMGQFEKPLQRGGDR
jgi:hypothetical protein